MMRQLRIINFCINAHFKDSSFGGIKNIEERTYLVVLGYYINENKPTESNNQKRAGNDIEDT